MKSDFGITVSACFSVGGISQRAALGNVDAMGL
jgi:hypothetical protein